MIKSQTVVKKNPFLQTPKESKRRFYKSMSEKAKALFNKNRNKSNSLLNLNINNINKTLKTSKDNSINYIYQKNNPNLINPSKRIFSFMKNSQELNDLKNNKNNIFSYFNKNTENNKNVNENNASENLNSNYKYRTSTKARNYRGLPQKSPISITDGVKYEKYSTNDKKDKNVKFNINNENTSFISVKSKQSNHNLTVSNNFSNKTLKYHNYRYAINNDKNLFNNYSSLTKSVINNNTPYKNFNINKNLNKSINFKDISSNDIFQKDKDNDKSKEEYKSKDNININNSYRNNTFLASHRKYLSKTPIPQKDISFIKPKNNFKTNIINNNNNKTYINNKNQNSLFGQNENKKMNYTYSNNFYKNYRHFNNNYNQELYNDANKNTYSNSQVNNNVYLGYNKEKEKDKDKDNKDSSSNIKSYRFNTNNMNKTYSNSFKPFNLNSSINANNDSNRKIINRTYNNKDSKIDKLHVYKSHFSQNNSIDSKYKKESKGINSKEETKNNTKDNSDGFYKDKNMNYNNSEKRIIHFYNLKKNMIRNNSSSGVGVVDESNRNLYPKNIDNQNQTQPNISLKINDTLKNNNNNRRPKKEEENVKPPVNKTIRKIHQYTHVGFNGVKDKDFNQDIAFIEKNFAGNSSYVYFGVCDGHGVVGHEVSEFIKNILPKELSKSLNQKDILTEDTKSKKKIFNIIDDVFITINDKLTYNDSINSLYSGTTCVSVIYTPKKLICANIGDSRAVLGRYDKNTKKWVAIDLSRDHKPTEKDEAKRILNRGGRIKPFTDEVTGEEYGPQRIWVKKEEVPGLAMTRSFGDRVAASVGCICLPETKDFNFEEDDKFLILASDGIWEFIESNECINIIGKYYFSNNIESCCKYLYNESRKRWIKEEEVVDDITLLLVFFD